MRLTFLLVFMLVASAAYAEQVPLRDYLENQIREQDKRIDQAAAAAREAKEILQTSTTRRLDLLFEAQASYEAATYATRTVMDTRLSAQDSKITELQQSRDRVFGAILIIGVIGVANLVKLFWVDRVPAEKKNA